MLPQMMPLPWSLSLGVAVTVVISFYLMFSWYSPTHSAEKTTMKAIFIPMPW